jgi:cytochrome c-type biogenesis protein CcsB
MSGVELVRYSFYGFTAASLAILIATVLYLTDVAWLARMPQPAGGGGSVSPWRLTPSGMTTAGWLAQVATRFGLVFAGVAVILRTIVARRGPYSDMYEFSVAFIFVILIGYVLVERAYQTRAIGVVVLPLALGMTAYVWSLPPSVREVRGLIPALQSSWVLTAHVTSGVVAYAAFAISFGAAVLYLVVDRWPRTWLPSTALLDDAGFRAVAVGFPAQTMLLILGSLWAHQAWGAYWQWDPKETAALVTFLVYGAYLHTRSLRGWRGRRSAVFLAAAFATVVFAYYGNYWFGGLHAYGGV